jgi:hypothetical protein
MFSVWSVQNGYEEVFGSVEKGKRRVEFRDASLPGYELGGQRKVN